MICRSKVKFSFAGVVFFSLFLLQRTGVSDQPVPSVYSLQELVGEWVDLRKEIAQEKQKWEEQKEQINQEYSFLSKESEQLLEEKKLLEMEKSSSEKERLKLIAGKKVLKKVLDQLQPALLRAEEDLLKLARWIPGSLFQKLEKHFDLLKHTESKTVSERLKLLLALTGEIESLQSEVHLVKQIITAENGEQREFDVIYLGLAQAYCVSGDDNFAGAGFPSEDTWSWKWFPDIAQDVRKAVQVYKQEKMAEYIALPFSLSEVAP